MVEAIDERIENDFVRDFGWWRELGDEWERHWYTLHVVMVA